MRKQVHPLGKILFFNVIFAVTLTILISSSIFSSNIETSTHRRRTIQKRFYVSSAPILPYLYTHGIWLSWYHLRSYADIRYLRLAHYVEFTIFHQLLTKVWTHQRTVNVILYDNIIILSFNQKVKIFLKLSIG